MTTPNFDAPHRDHRMREAVDEAVRGIQRTLSDAVAAAVGEHDRCAMLMFRDYDNFGDAAIWLGGLAVLDQLGVEVRYSQPLYRLHRRSLLRAVGDGPVLVSGGGSFGDIYRKTQRFTYEIIESFTDRRIVVLPQTVFFRDPSALEEAKQVLGRHPDLVLMCRDHESFHVAEGAFDCAVQLVPDLAFALQAYTTSASPTEPVLWLLRRDSETRASDGAAYGHDAASRDWEDVLTGDPDCRHRVRREELMYRVARRVVNRAPRVHSGRLQPIASARRLAEARVSAAFTLLASAECVVTDRLHAHLLAVLLRRSTIACDNSFGKVRWFYETWTDQLPTTAWANDAAEIDAALDRLVPAG